jgi:puromycin-sensitive aminopeptidase
MLIDESNSSSQTRQWVAIVVCHELAHQWFGNLVTMEWWTHLWLNEGFASFMEYFAVNELFPQWNIWDQFVTKNVTVSLNLDCLRNSHPIEVEVNHPDEVQEIFDAISYYKGSCVVRMLENWLGPEMFQKSIAAYMKKYQYNNALSSELWATLAEISGLPVNDMMEGWTKQVGFPVLTIHEEKFIDNQTIEYSVSQNRFFINGVDAEDHSEWYIPVSFLISNHKEVVHKQSFKDKEGKISLKLPANSSNPSWVKLNAYQGGLYRVLYTPSMLSKLSAAIRNNDSSLTSSDKLGLQSDAFAFTRAGLLPVQQLFELVDSYKNELDYSLWNDISSNLIDLSTLLKSDEKLNNLMSKWMSSLYSNILNKVGWDKSPQDSHADSLLRAKIISTVGCKFHDADTTAEAVKRFVSYFTAVTSKNEAGEVILAADLRAAAYYMAVKSGGLLGYEAVLTLLKYTEMHEEIVRLIDSLAAASEPLLIIRTCHYALSGEVRKQDAPTLIQAIGNNSHQSLAILWDFLQDNWAVVVKLFGSSFGMSRIVDTLGNFSDLARAEEVEKFFAVNKAPGGERAVKQAIESIKSNATWLNRDKQAIDKWLTQRVGA